MATPLQEMGLAVKRLQVRHHQAANAALAALDISIVQWDALRHLEQTPGASLHDLARLTADQQAVFHELLGQLVPGPAA